jgi:hypothetical protein
MIECTLSNITYEDLSLVNDNGRLYLSVKFLVENSHRVERYTIPRIVIPFDTTVIPNIQSRYDDYYPRTKDDLKISTGYYPALDIEKLNGVAYTVETVNEKPQKLTVAEIEKKLGYKIEIVSEESNK